MAAKTRVQAIHVHECGWKRDITSGDEWAKSVIDHPQWGTVTQLQAAENDVKTHDCGTYLASRAHTPRAHEKPVNYNYTRKRK